MFDRGENNQNNLLIYFEERIKFEDWNVENNLKKEYYLVGAINEILDYKYYIQENFFLLMKVIRFIIRA